MKKIEEIPFKNKRGVFNPGDQIIVEVGTYGGATMFRTGTYLGVAGGRYRYGKPQINVVYENDKGRRSYLQRNIVYPIDTPLIELT